MAEQYCSQMLDSFLKLVHHSRSSIPAFCVSHFTFSLVATLGNLLVIRALIKASMIPANVRKMFDKSGFLWSCSWIVAAAYGRYYLCRGVEDGVKARQLSLPLSNGFKRAFLFWLSSRRCIFPGCYCHCRRQASRCFVPFVISGAYHTQTCYNSAGVCMNNKLRLSDPIYFISKRNWNCSCGYFNNRICSNYRGVCSYLQSCQVSSKSDIQSKSVSKCPNKGGTPTKEVRLQ